MRLDPGGDRTTRRVDATIDARIESLAACRANDVAIGEEVLDITRSLRFESFSYLVACDARPHNDARLHVWTTLPREWVARYERMRYADVDPRVTHSWNRATPYVWDAARSSGEWQVQQFLRDAAAFGVCSGVVVSFRDAQHARVVVALNSPVTPVSLARRAEIQRHLGDVMLLATSFHDLFMRRLRDSRSDAHVVARQLSPRERQCLQMAARGLTSADIGTKLGITERTANFHFSNVISKLGVLNRHEAIARAVSTGMISLGSSD